MRLIRRPVYRAGSVVVTLSRGLLLLLRYIAMHEAAQAGRFGPLERPTFCRDISDRLGDG